jgi:hypothetical protein
MELDPLLGEPVLVIEDLSEPFPGDRSETYASMPRGRKDFRGPPS